MGNKLDNTTLWFTQLYVLHCMYVNKIIMIIFTLKKLAIL